MEYYSTIKRTDSDTYYNTDDPKDMLSATSEVT